MERPSGVVVVVVVVPPQKSFDKIKDRTENTKREWPCSTGHCLTGSWHRLYFRQRSLLYFWEPRPRPAPRRRDAAPSTGSQLPCDASCGTRDPSGMPHRGRSRTWRARTGGRVACASRRTRRYSPPAGDATPWGGKQRHGIPGGRRVPPRLR